MTKNGTRGVLALCVLASLVQGGTCYSFSDVENQLLPTLQQLESDISNFIASGPTAISGIQSTIDSSVATGNGNVADALDGLNSDVTNTAAKLSKSGKDVTQCSDPVKSAIAALDVSNVLTACLSNFEFKAIEDQISGLNSALSTVTNSIDSCSEKNSLDLTAFGQCVVDDINSAQAQLNNVQDQLDDLLIAVPQVNSCITAAAKNVKAQIAAVQGVFDTCASGIESIPIVIKFPPKDKSTGLAPLTTAVDSKDKQVDIIGGILDILNPFKFLSAFVKKVIFKSVLIIILSLIVIFIL